MERDMTFTGACGLPSTLGGLPRGRPRMSAGFKVADEVFWGTNGAVEAYAEALAAQATARLGPNDPLSVYFQEERDGFYGGKILFLDEWLADDAGRERFLGLLDAATEQLFGRGRSPSTAWSGSPRWWPA